MNSPKSDKELDEWLELLSSSTHSPQGKFSAEKSYNILQQRLQPAYRKHKIRSIRYTLLFNDTLTSPKTYYLHCISLISGFFSSQHVFFS